MANHISFHFMVFHGILQFVFLSCCSHLFWMFNLVSYSLLYEELKFIPGIQFCLLVRRLVCKLWFPSYDAVLRLMPKRSEPGFCLFSFIEQRVLFHPRVEDIHNGGSYFSFVYLVTAQGFALRTFMPRCHAILQKVLI